MKQSIIALLILTFAVSASATTPRTASAVDWTKAEKNYLVALGSDNIGLRKSAASFLAEYRLTGAVQPLIEMLRNDKVEQMRMAAALALVQLGNKDGMDAVKEASVYDGSEKVARFCQQLLDSSSQELSLK